MGSGMSGGGGGGDGGGLSSGSASRSDSKGLSVASAGMILKRLHSWKPESAKLTGSDVIQTLQSMDAFGFEPNPTPSYKTVFGAIVTLFGGLLYTALIMGLFVAFFAAEAELALAGVAHEPAMVLVSPAMASLGDKIEALRRTHSGARARPVAARAAAVGGSQRLVVSHLRPLTRAGGRRAAPASA